MPRPQRCRRICKAPIFSDFVPKGSKYAEKVVLLCDEFETIRLVDWENRTHEQCAAQMGIARSTVTEIYETARRKIADCIVHGKELVIGGGNYRICDGSATACRYRDCKKRRDNNGVEKGDCILRIAVAYEDGNIFQHFGHTAKFKFYDAENGIVTASETADTQGSGHGALADFLAARGTDVLICGGIGGAQAALARVGIRLYGGVSGSADRAVEAFLAGELAYDPNVRCTHHDKEHGDRAHTCGEHGCGKHTCH